MRRCFSRHWVSVRKGNASWVQPQPDNFPRLLLWESLQTSAQEEGDGAEPCRMLELRRLCWEYRKTKKDGVCHPESYEGKNVGRENSMNLWHISLHIWQGGDLCVHARKQLVALKNSVKWWGKKIFSVQSGSEKYLFPTGKLETLKIHKELGRIRRRICCYQYNGDNKNIALLVCLTNLKKKKTLKACPAGVVQWLSANPWTGRS